MQIFIYAILLIVGASIGYSIANYLIRLDKTRNKSNNNNDVEDNFCYKRSTSYSDIIPNELLTVEDVLAVNDELIRRGQYKRSVESNVDDLRNNYYDWNNNLFISILDDYRILLSAHTSPPNFDRSTVGSIISTSIMLLDRNKCMAILGYVPNPGDPPIELIPIRVKPSTIKQ